MTRLRKKLENLAIAIKIRNINDVRKYAKNTILILEEIGKPVKDNYTKVIIIKFDKKNEFKVKSYHEIEKV